MRVGWRKGSTQPAPAGTVSGFFFSGRRRHTSVQGDWSSDVCSSDLVGDQGKAQGEHRRDRGQDGRMPQSQAVREGDGAPRDDQRLVAAVVVAFVPSVRSLETLVDRKSVV